MTTRTIRRYARMFGTGLALTIATSAMVHAQSEADALRDQVDDLTASLDGQYDVNADYADQIASLTDQLADAQQDARVSGDPTAPARGHDDRATWHGFSVGEVIVCPKGWEVSVDQAEAGRRWAACM